MKLGIIGSGIIVQEFLPKLVKMEDMEIVAIQGVKECEDQVKQLCQENNIPNDVYDFEVLCKLDIDTVYVAVPNFLHYMYCKQALEKGLNVIVEKPITSNDTEAKELAALAKEKKLFLFEAVTTLYFDSYKKIKENLSKIGDVKLVNLNYTQYSRRYNAFRAGEILPVFDPKKSGGALMDLNLYNLHYTMGLFGEPKSYKYYANIERGIDTSGTLMMDYETFKATLTAAKDCSAPLSFVIQGTDGFISMKYPPNVIGEVTIHLNDGTEEVIPETMFIDRLLPEFSEFIRCINAKDYDTCYKMLDESVKVSTVQTKARLDAGVIFPCDNVESAK